MKADGWRPLYKQREAGGGDFAAVWTPSRELTALEYGGGIILDEDMGPEERAADRAERFAGYREKRTGEASERADRYESGPSVHGYQNPAKAERAAERHNRIADRALDAWSKAEYWQRRTEGVIRHALHVSSPSVRMGRIKRLESELREVQSRYTPNASHQETTYKNEQGEPEVYVFCGQGRAIHPVKKSSLEGIKAGCESWETHLTLRLAYERQMLAAQGGRLADADLEVGGHIYGKQIHKVNKSTVTGRVVSVYVRGDYVEGWCYQQKKVPGVTEWALHMIDTERLKPDAYRPPTEEDKAALAAVLEAAKKTRPKVETIPLINPTDEDAERLQALWNERARERWEKKNKESHGVLSDFKPTEITKTTQAIYSAKSSGTYGVAKTSTICANGLEYRSFGGCHADERQKNLEMQGPAMFKVRTRSTSGFSSPDSVIVLTDKPQKPLPAKFWEPFDKVAKLIAAAERGREYERLDAIRAAAGADAINGVTGELIFNQSAA